MKQLEVAIVGAGMTEFGELFNMSYEDLIAEAYLKCIKSVEKGLDEKEIKAGWIGTFSGRSIRRDLFSGSALSDPVALPNLPVTRLENACASGSDAIRNAAFAIAAGIYDVVVVIGAEKMRDVPSRDAMVEPAALQTYLWWMPRGMSAPLNFGQYGTAHMEAFGTKREHFAMVAVKNHDHGLLNPHSYLKMKITVEDVLKARIVSWPLGTLDCCPTTDGAAAVILTSKKRAKDFTDRPIYLTGTGLATDYLGSYWKDTFLGWRTTTEAAKQAYQMAAISPKELDLAELHDCFTCTELISYEDLGFCEKGTGGRWIEEGNPRLDGILPCNPSGGLKSKGHPIGATGVAQACEMYWQLREEAGQRQVKKARVGLTHNLGGTGSVACVNIYEIY